MKQVVLRGGQPTVADIPAPSPERGRILVASAASVISSGTERSSLSSGGGSLPMRAIRNPDLVVKTLQHAREHGVRETMELVRGAISDDSPLGYACAGIVLDTGGVADFTVGQRVACAGAGNANHAEVVSIPANLVAAVPDDVSLRDAAFTTLGAIALQGVRRADPTLGERVVVVGLGLLGLLTVQLLRAAGCQVLGVEPVGSRRELALRFGVERAIAPDGAVDAVLRWSGGVGADIVIVTASSASSSIVNDAVTMVRRKGRVVPVGDVGLGLERPDLYQREADVLISTSYGPGRYDPSYEEGGIDYPIAYVRWTENRNMEEFLRLLDTGAVDVAALVDVELPVDRAPEAYEAIRAPEAPLAAVLTYDAGAGARAGAVRIARAGKRIDGALRIAVIGPGAFVRGTHLPNLKADGRATVVAVASRRGTTASDVARSLGGADASTDWESVIVREDVDLVIIGTRHDSHAAIAAAALRAGKAVFVEKPLGLSFEEIDDVWAAATENPRLAIGFNRPFAPLAVKLAQELGARSGPIQLLYRVNAPLDAAHWLNDPVQGGGRILGEACHMFDFANALCGVPRFVMAGAPPSEVGSVESANVTVTYEDGSVATVAYSGLGGASMPKERIEVFRGGSSWVLDDFRALTTFDGSRETSSESSRVDKGHRPMLSGVIDALLAGEAPRPGIESAYLAQSVALGALESIAGSEVVGVRRRPGDA